MALGKFDKWIMEWNDRYGSKWFCRFRFGQLSINAERAKVGDYSISYMAEDISFVTLMNNHKMIKSYIMLIKPLDSGSWILMTSLIIITSLLINFISNNNIIDNVLIAIYSLIQKCK